MEWNSRGDHLRHSHDNSRGDVDDIMYELLYSIFIFGSQCEYLRGSFTA